MAEKACYSALYVERDFILSNPKCAHFSSLGYRVAWQAVTYPIHHGDVTTPGCKWGIERWNSPSFWPFRPKRKVK